MRTLLRRTAWTLAALLLLPALYLGSAWFLVLFPLNDGPPLSGEPLPALIESNGVHTDFILPVTTSAMDWRSVFPPADFGPAAQGAELIAIGWGDREFYLNTPQWQDLTVGRAVGALSGRNGSVLHVRYVRRSELGGRLYRLPLAASQYYALIGHIMATARLDGRQRGVPVHGAHYDGNDAFYEAFGSYGPFTTCNTWIGDGLAHADVKVSRWTPFDFLVVRYLTPLAVQ